MPLLASCNTGPHRKLGRPVSIQITSKCNPWNTSQMVAEAGCLRSTIWLQQGKEKDVVEWLSPEGQVSQTLKPWLQ